MAAVLIRVYAALLAALGLALLFAPELLAAEPPVLGQLVGAGLIGFAAANWTGRGLLLGGIHGRALVVGNQAFAFVGALVLVRPVLAHPTVGTSVLLAVLAFGAALYSVMMFGSPKA